MATNEELAELLFPEVKGTIAQLEEKYPPRALPEGAEVTRFAPSPTGFLHTGSLFTSMISHRIAKSSGGVYFFRLEDTDTKRTIEGSGDLLIKELHAFGIDADEGYFPAEYEGGLTFMEADGVKNEIPVNAREMLNRREETKNAAEDATV